MVLVVSTGEAENNRKLFTEHKVACPVLLQKEMEVAAPYKAHGTPTGYLINPDGKIASELTVGGEALLALARPQGPALAGRFSNRSLARSKIKRDGLKAGTLAPDFRLPRLDGGELSLKELRGRRVLLVFSDPECGPCNALAPQLEKFYRETGRHSRPPSPGGEEAPAPALELVMISRREPKENRAKVKEHGLTFPLVLQQHWEIPRTYAMFATPMAYFIDEAGIIAHDVAVGVEPILALMAMAGRMQVETPSNAS